MSNIEIRRGTRAWGVMQDGERIACANVPDRLGTWKIPGIEGAIRVEIPEWDIHGLPKSMTLEGEILKGTPFKNRKRRKASLGG